ncbi:class I SAM-dependent methyltransferase [Nonomuraea sp. KC401]|uniref:class I SAM-dependent methyltransferase n=1 Tax=unclassified Nonomuraea TaxID=2593643 RepID=UPI0010FE38B4|nr:MULTISPECIES: class I SAM-dependent methyltransferase [unclassified Nonomuraea]NBE91880.1 class I SAM-dependent methyltransferase [Nonomuraea sp. K271]TLF75521.1 class I SAM-dependent methyltransferase [Nonomuraea sp. KC401]
MQKVQLSGEKATMLATLYGRAVDAESPTPILGDTMALEAVRAIDTDFTKVGMKRGDAVTVARRARHLDDWTRDFLAEHPAAIVLHLGCGMDTRAHRVGPGPGVHWYDVDFPEVIDLRERLYPAREQHTAIPSSVTDLTWLDHVKGDLPVLVVAEGLTMYLTEAEGHTLFRAIIDRFPSGTFVFDAFSRRGISWQKINRVVRLAGATLHWGVDGPADLTSIDPRLRLVTALSAFDLPGYDKLRPGYRALAAVGRTLPFMRRMAVFYRLDFPA